MLILENIQTLCKEHNMSVPKLEKELGFGNGAIYKWEKSSPTIDKLQKVASYFKVSLDIIVYGFEITELTQLVNYIKDGRSYEQFSEDTGVELNELTSIGIGIILKPPTIETLEKISSSNPVEYLVSENDLLKAAGYSTKQSEANQKESSAISTAGDEENQRGVMETLKNIADKHSYDLRDPEFVDQLNKALAFVKSIRSDKKN